MSTKQTLAAQILKLYDEIASAVGRRGMRQFHVPSTTRYLSSGAGLRLLISILVDFGSGLLLEEEPKSAVSISGRLQSLEMQMSLPLCCKCQFSVLAEASAWMAVSVPNWLSAMFHVVD